MAIYHGVISRLPRSSSGATPMDSRYRLGCCAREAFAEFDTSGDGLIGKESHGRRASEAARKSACWLPKLIQNMFTSN